MCLEKITLSTLLSMSCRAAAVTVERQTEGYVLKSRQEIVELETKLVALGSRQI